MPRTWGWVFAAGLALLVVFGWCQRARDDAERVQAIAQADTLRHRSDSLEARRVADSLVAAQRTQALADSLVRAGRQLQRLTLRAGQAEAALRARPDSLLPRGEVEGVLAAKDSVVLVQAQQLLTLAADTVAWRDRWAQASRDGQAWHQIALDAQTQLARANQRTKPRRLGCTGGATGMVGLVGNGGLGVGLTCGWHF